MDEILRYEYTEFIEFVEYAIKQQNDDLLMTRWITNYEREMSFQDFKAKLGVNSDISTTRKDSRKREDIISDTEKLYQNYEWR